MVRDAFGKVVAATPRTDDGPGEYALVGPVSFESDLCLEPHARAELRLPARPQIRALELAL